MSSTTFAYLYHPNRTNFLRRNPWHYWSVSVTVQSSKVCSLRIGWQLIVSSRIYCSFTDFWRQLTGSWRPQWRVRGVWSWDVRFWQGDGIRPPRVFSSWKSQTIKHPLSAEEPTRTWAYVTHSLRNKKTESSLENDFEGILQNYSRKT